MALKIWIGSDNTEEEEAYGKMRKRIEGVDEGAVLSRVYSAGVGGVTRKP